MSITQASSEYFQKVAGSWDDLSADFFGPAVRDAAIAKAYLRPEMIVADVGAGTGFIAAGLAPRVKRVHLVDGSAEMLDVARGKLSEFKNVEFHVADGLALPFPEEGLDAVFANMYLHHAVDPLAAIREMVRVLRPGGRLVITDEDAHPYTWLKEEMADVWQGFDRDQIRAWFAEAGLVNVIVDCTGQSCCAESCNTAITDEQGRQASISIFVATGTKRMVMREAVRESYGTLAEQNASGETCACGSQSSASAGQSCACGGGGGCCGGEQAASALDSALNAGYSQEELANAPQEAGEFSLGCGNPTALARLKPGEVVLDIGSGGGLDSFLAAEKVRPGGRVIGVDMTPAMLERARATALNNRIGNVEFRQGYAEELPVEDGSVDVILSNCVINLTEDKGRVFREAFRVLKPGGRLEVSDVVASGAVPIELRESPEGWAECITGALPEPEYIDLIEQAGFQEVSVRRSPSVGYVLDVGIYSAMVSAIKPGK